MTNRPILLPGTGLPARHNERGEELKVVHPIRHGRTGPAGGTQASNAGREAGGPDPGPRSGPQRAAGPGRQAGAPGLPHPAGRRRQLRLTGRGAVLGMFAVFFLGLLLSEGLGWAWLAGAAFLAGSTAAARYSNQRGLLAVAVSPPLLFLCALILARLLTAAGNVLVSAAEGTLLTLAGVAPWLFAGVAITLLVATVRGLPGCIRDLRRDLHPEWDADPARPGQSRRATPQ